MEGYKVIYLFSFEDLLQLYITPVFDFLLLLFAIFYILFVVYVICYAIIDFVRERFIGPEHLGNI